MPMTVEEYQGETLRHSHKDPDLSDIFCFSRTAVRGGRGLQGRDRGRRGGGGAQERALRRDAREVHPADGRPLLPGPVHAQDIPSSQQGELR